jgi:hypothetical protein
MGGGEARRSWVSFYPSIRCNRISGRIALWRNSQNLPPFRGTPFLRQGKKDGAPGLVCCGGYVRWLKSSVFSNRGEGEKYGDDYGGSGRFIAF